MTRSRGAGWAGDVIVGGCVVAATATVGVLHVTGRGVADPLRTVISDYVGVSWGYALLAVAAVALATACLVLAAGLGAAGLPRPGLPVALLVSAAAALLTAAVFPTNLPGTPAGVAANVHRAAGGWAFVVVPLAGWWVAERATAVDAWRVSARWLRRWSGLAGLVTATYLLIHVPIVIAGSPGFPYLGGVERVVCAAMMVVLWTSARATRLATGAVADDGTSASTRITLRAEAAGAFAAAGRGRTA